MALLTPVSPGQTADAPATPDPLSGPSVDPADAGPTIVERSFDGSLKRPDIRPEEAALRKLTLTSAEQAAADAVLADRAAMLDGIVRDNLELLVRAQGARASGDGVEIAKVNKEFREALHPLALKGRLGEQLAAALEPDNARAFNRMVREYYRALVVQGNKGKPDGDPMPGDVDEMTIMDSGGTGGRRAALVRQLGEVFGQEVRRSYERIAAEGQARLDDLVKALDLSPEQDAKVREIALDFVQKNLKYPTQAQRAEVFRKVLAELTPEQRARAFGLLVK